MKHVGIIDDNKMMRSSISDYLGMVGDYEVTFSIGSFSELQVISQDVKVDYILLDIYLADVNGIEIIGLIKKIFPGAAVVVITGNVYDDYNLSKAIERGAASLLFKPFQMQQLIEVFDRLMVTPAYLLPEMADRLVLQLHQKYLLRAHLNMDISHSEEHIVNLLLSNYNRRQIADQLNISASQVNATITRLIHKAGCDNVKSLVQVLNEVLFRKQ
jgi:DNA-binding NarL/FixJ family response regulator